MAEIEDLNTTDASNTDRFPEGQAASTVNNGSRALEGIIARWHEDIGGRKASTGSANAYLFAAAQTLSAYYDGLTITFDANFSNTAAATLDVDSVSADAIVWPDQSPLVADDIVSGSKVTVRHDGTSWQLITVSRPVRMELRTEISTTSGTDHDHTGIGSFAKRITFMFDGLSTTGTGSIPMLQLGDATSFEATGYVGTVANVQTTPTVLAHSTGFHLDASHAGSAVLHGSLVLTLEDSANNTWVLSGSLARSNAAIVHPNGGTKSLTGVLTRVRLTTVNGTDTFDAGGFNILIE